MVHHYEMDHGDPREVKMNRQTAPIGIRIPDDLKQWLKSVAEESRRSINGQVIVILEAARRQAASQSEVRQ